MNKINVDEMQIAYKCLSNVKLCWKALNKLQKQCTTLKIVLFQYGGEDLSWLYLIPLSTTIEQI